jgi:hypothetical protein
MALILPLSIDEISYLDERDSPVIVSDTVNKEFISVYDMEDLTNFLANQDIEDNYVVNIVFIQDIVYCSINMPQLLLSRPFLVNRSSSPTLLNKFIDERLQLMIDLYYLDDSILNNEEFDPAKIFNY